MAENTCNKQRPRFTVQDNILVGNEPTYKVEKDGISKLVLDSLSIYPDFVGQINVLTGEQITFAEIKDLSIRCALWLQKQGIGKDDIVSIATPHQTDDYVPFLATLYVGAIFNPWYHKETLVSAEYFFDMIRPKIMFSCESSIDILSEAAKRAKVDCKFVVYGRHSIYPSLRDLLAEQSQAEVDSFRHIEPEDPAKQPGVLYFSSGTTGVPKTALLCYDSFVKHRKEFMLMRTGMNALWYSPWSWITGTNFVTVCIRLRAVRIIHGQSEPEEASKIIEKYKVNWAFISPTLNIQMVKAQVFERYDFSSMEIFIVGGSKPSKLVLEETQKHLSHAYVLNGYGITELGGVIAIHSKNRKKIDSIGHVVEGVSMKVFDSQTGSILGPNQQGELCFKLDCMMLGYLNNPIETRKMIDNEGWAHTGDLGYYDKNGEITITDRMKEVIITHNKRISPSQIEDILLRHPDVAEVAVVPVAHEIDIERPMAFVVKVPGGKVTANELQELPTTHQEDFRLTGGVVFVEKLPYTSTDKKSLRELKEMAKAYS